MQQQWCPTVCSIQWLIFNVFFFGKFQQQQRCLKSLVKSAVNQNIYLLLLLSGLLAAAATFATAACSSKFAQQSVVTANNNNLAGFGNFIALSHIMLQIKPVQRKVFSFCEHGHNSVNTCFFPESLSRGVAHFATICNLSDIDATTSLFHNLYLIFLRSNL